MKTFTLYVINSTTGSSRDMTMRACSAEKAREYAVSVIKNGESVLTVFPSIYGRDVA